MASFRASECSAIDNVDRSVGASGASSVFADDHEPQPVTAVTMSVPPIGSIDMPSILLTTASVAETSSVETVVGEPMSTATENGSGQ
jgi:hypothetical protein